MKTDVTGKTVVSVKSIIAWNIMATKTLSFVLLYSQENHIEKTTIYSK